VRARVWTGSDRGSGPVTALLIMGVLALVLAIGITAGLSAAGEERSGAQHAADAAALAGAQSILDDAPDDLAPGFLRVSDIPAQLGGGVCSQNGRAEATRLAGANDATLTSYCYDVWSDTVSTSVRLDESHVGDTKAIADAEAVTGFAPAECRLASAFEPPEEPSTPPEDDDDAEEEDDDPPPPPPPPATVNTTVDCGFGDLPVVFRTATSRFTFTDLAAALEDLDPRLTD
jgi:hypothetical protein